MEKPKNKLSRKQRLFLIDLIFGSLSEQDCLKAHKIELVDFHRWQTDEVFADKMMRFYSLKNRLTLVQHIGKAIEQLYRLCESEQTDVARKACLDIFNLNRDILSFDVPKEIGASAKNNDKLTASNASRMLAVLAEDEQKKGEV